MKELNISDSQQKLLDELFGNSNTEQSAEGCDVGGCGTCGGCSKGATPNFEYDGGFGDIGSDEEEA